jgi:hypothetical protein
MTHRSRRKSHASELAERAREGPAIFNESHSIQLQTNVNSHIGDSVNRLISTKIPQDRS